MKKRHTKGKGSKMPGQILEVSAPIHISNIKLVDAPKKTAKAPKAKK
jgi:ribosomal protein L24